ncbi:hypothetical protein Dd1591_1164 [Dickeya chrysanthemi Ech1591]|uniref:Uncharacterized protein n=1 Tax=Dickeya chrysanthemi (strain Ech1591) TaxID=561229 RepID=C6CPH6_DICC1|nr:hypothetical protein Dd1591_1164 [Dickeya chrysanthemi Ech1591]
MKSELQTNGPQCCDRVLTTPEIFNCHGEIMARNARNGEAVKLQT